MNQKRNVVFSFLGTNLDRGFDERRWAKWRPTISLCQQEDFLVDRLELLYQKNFKSLAKRVKDDVELVFLRT